MTTQTWQIIVTALISTGGVTLVTRFFRGWQSLRTGARASTRGVIEDLAKSRDETEDRYGAALRDLEFWRNTAGSYMFQMRRQGLMPDPADPVPPSMNRLPSPPAIRPRRRKQDPPVGE